MLRITQNNSAAGASAYFDEGLAKSDYYAESTKEVIGLWGGIAAERMGLRGEIQKQDFTALCHNIHPITGKQLNPRESEKRKIGYDFTFSAPKSVSLIHAVTGDERIRETFAAAVRETMQELEQDARCQTGQGKDKRHEQTGNMVWGEFIHLTSRPVDGSPDCHLHAHCFAFNTTWNDRKQRFQAGEFGSIKTDAPYYEAAFDARFAHKMQALGYDVERRGLSWEVNGIGRDTLEKFSRRTKLIEAEAEKRGIKSDKLKGELGAKTRDSKRKGESWEELRESWKARLTTQELAAVETAGKPVAGEKKNEVRAADALEYAVNHSFERKSAVEEKRLLTQALKRGFGSVTPEALKEAATQRHFLANELNGRKYLTTEEALKEERQMLARIRDGRGKLAPINPDYQPQAEYLNGEQKAAIRHVMTSRDRVTVVEGGAGTGKTTLMKEVRDGTREGGREIFGFAPSAAASRGVLREEGFTEADTVARLLTDQEMQAKVKGQVIWIDEAGMVGNKTMNQLLALAEKQNARLLLTGDTRQHGSADAGDALRISMEKSGLEIARVNQIQRQKPSKDYKKAVKLLSENKIGEGFDKLDRMGCVRELASRDERHAEMAADYAAIEKAGKTALVVAPTHREGEEVTAAIRQKLKAENRIGAEEREFTRQRNLNLTVAEKCDPAQYQPGQAVQFHQNVKGFVAGEKWEVSRREGDRILVTNGKGQEKPLDLTHATRFSLYAKESIRLAAGDRVRITQNGKSLEGTRLNNGNIYAVTGFDKAGNLRLSNGNTLDKDYRNIQYGYVVTSHASQGKTVDRVLIAQSSTSFPASSRQQFYVSVSRGREAVTIYTDNRKELKQAIQRSGERMTASEVAEKKRNSQKLVSRLKALAHSYKTRLRQKTTERHSSIKPGNYGKDKNMGSDKAVL